MKDAFEVASHMPRRPRKVPVAVLVFLNNGTTKENHTFASDQTIVKSRWTMDRILIIVGMQKKYLWINYV